MNIASAPLVEAAALVRSRQVSAHELVDAQLARIGRLDPQLGCYLEVFSEEALAEADRLDREAARHALWLIASADAASNLLDVVRRCPDVNPLVRSRIEAGERVSSAELADALATQRRLTSELEAAFRDVDVLLLPLAPFVSYVLGEREVMVGEVREDVSAAVTRYTPLFSLTGAPALSLPFRRGANGLPVAVQLAAARGNETTLLRVARALEAASEWPAGG